MIEEIIRAGRFVCQHDIAAQHIYAQNSPKHQRYSAIGIWRSSKFGQYARLWKT
jgi:hypothetical protein